MVILGLLGIVVAAMVVFAVVNVQKPLTVDEQALLGRWVSDDPEYERDFYFKPDRTCDKNAGEGPTYRWKLEGPFLVVKELSESGGWVRLGPIQLDGDELRLTPEGKILRRAEEQEADGNE